MAAGTYFYSSDSVWKIPLYMAGRVTVEADSTDMDLEVMVNMTDVEAFHDLATGKKIFTRFSKIYFSIRLTVGYEMKTFCHSSSVHLFHQFILT